MRGWSRRCRPSQWPVSCCTSPMPVSAAWRSHGAPQPAYQTVHESHRVREPSGRGNTSQAQLHIAYILQTSADRVLMLVKTCIMSINDPPGESAEYYDVSRRSMYPIAPFAAAPSPLVNPLRTGKGGLWVSRHTLTPTWARTYGTQAPRNSSIRRNRTSTFDTKAEKARSGRFQLHCAQRGRQNR